MSFFSNLVTAVSGLVPHGIAFHPEFKVTKTSEGVFDVTWSAAGSSITGTNHASLVLAGDKFTITGDISVIGADSVFPFNVLAQVVNSALQGAVGSGPTVLKSTNLLPVKSAAAVDEVVKGAVGTTVTVAAVKSVTVKDK